MLPTVMSAKDTTSNGNPHDDLNPVHSNNSTPLRGGPPPDSGPPGGGGRGGGGGHWGEAVIFPMSKLSGIC